MEVDSTRKKQSVKSNVKKETGKLNGNLLKFVLKSNNCNNNAFFQGLADNGEKVKYWEQVAQKMKMEKPQLKSFTGLFDAKKRVKLPNMRLC